MRIIRLYDCIINGLLPIVLGLIIYFFADINWLSSTVKNFLPDGLWGYAFISLLLIIWNRRINFLWLTTAFLSAVCYEWFQHLHLVKGTGDWQDVLAYFLCMSIAVATNSYFRIKFNYTL